MQVPSLPSVCRRCEIQVSCCSLRAQPLAYTCEDIFSSFPGIYSLAQRLRNTVQTGVRLEDSIRAAELSQVLVCRRHGHTRFSVQGKSIPLFLTTYTHSTRQDRQFLAVIGDEE